MVKCFEEVDFLPAFRYGYPLQEDAVRYLLNERRNVERLVLFAQYP